MARFRLERQREAVKARAGDVAEEAGWKGRALSLDRRNVRLIEAPLSKHTKVQSDCGTSYR